MKYSNHAFLLINIVVQNPLLHVCWASALYASNPAAFRHQSPPTARSPMTKLEQTQHLTTVALARILVLICVVSYILCNLNYQCKFNIIVFTQTSIDLREIICKVLYATIWPFVRVRLVIHVTTNSSTKISGWRISFMGCVFIHKIVRHSQVVA